jgi:hypothetical protein
MSTIISEQSPDLSEIIGDVVGITQELFPGEVLTYVLDDPEYSEGRLTVIEAQASGPVDGLVERRAEWHRRVSRLGESCSSLCLTFKIQSFEQDEVCEQIGTGISEYARGISGR